MAEDKRYFHADESRKEGGKDAVELRAELDRVSSRLNIFNYKDGGANMNDWMKVTQSFDEEFATLEPKLTFISNSIRDELLKIKGKEEGELRECFERQLEEYRKAKDKLKELQVAHEEHNENSLQLSDDLKSIAEELDRSKKQIDTIVSKVTDANPLVEIRAAIQRLRTENKELDIHIGMLDYELTEARCTQSRNSNIVEEIEEEND